MQLTAKNIPDFQSDKLKSGESPTIEGTQEETSNLAFQTATTYLNSLIRFVKSQENGPEVSGQEPDSKRKDGLSDG